jgi:hypothetical protein
MFQLEMADRSHIRGKLTCFPAPSEIVLAPLHFAVTMHRAKCAEGSGMRTNTASQRSKSDVTCYGSGPRADRDVMHVSGGRLRSARAARSWVVTVEDALAGHGRHDICPSRRKVHAVPRTPFRRPPAWSAVRPVNFRQPLSRGSRRSLDDTTLRAIDGRVAIFLSKRGRIPSPGGLPVEQLQELSQGARRHGFDSPTRSRDRRNDVGPVGYAMALIARLRFARKISTLVHQRRAS